MNTVDTLGKLSFEYKLANLIFDRYIRYQKKPRGIIAKLVPLVYVSKMLKECVAFKAYQINYAFSLYSANAKPDRIEDTSKVVEPEEMLSQTLTWVYLYRLNSKAFWAGMQKSDMKHMLEFEFSQDTKKRIMDLWKKTWVK